MLLGIAVAGVPCLALVAVLRRRTGAAWAWSLGLLLWSLATIGVLTLGGPAPDGFWIVSGGQRLLNAVIFVPSGALLVLVLARWRSARWTIPVGLLGLGLVSVAIEATQQVLARLDRSCDVTDVVDNLTGAAIGVLVGLALLPLVRPWRR